MNDQRPSIEQRKAEVRRRLTMSAVVERHVKLSGTAGAPKRRGKCPFHGSNSPSLALFEAASGEGSAHCFGCQWNGDMFAFQQAIRGIGFMDALAELEALCSATASGYLSADAHGPVKRERNPSAPRRRDLIEPIDMARAIWRDAYADVAAVRRYFMGRGLPERVLTDARLASFRYHSDCPCVPWRLDGNGSGPGACRKGPPRGLPIAPAIMAMVRVPQLLGDPPRLEFVPTGLHVTFLNPAGDGTMVRRKPWAVDDDPDPMLPKRRMLGPVGGGAIVIGEYSAEAHLYVGEGNETVLGAMALADAPPEAVGVATLSLGNLQGEPRLWKNRTWPLFDMEPDPEHPPFTIPGHRGPVTGLVDSDMKPLRGMLLRQAQDGREREFAGEAVVERKGGPIVRRAITGAERARICGELVVKGWRAATPARPVDAVRAPPGMDFNDAAAARAKEARAA